MNTFKIRLATVIFTLTLVCAGNAATQEQNVKVVNTEREPVPTVVKGITSVEKADEPGKQPLVFHYSETMEGDIPFGVVIYEVPDGKRAVIEQVTVNTRATEKDLFLVTIILNTALTTESFHTDHYIAPGHVLYSGSGKTANATATHQTRFYAGPSTEIRISLRKNKPLSGLSVNFSFTGYLVDVPPPPQR